MMMSPSRLTIFEGPDGSGKTTAAKAWAERTGALYVHLGPSPKRDRDLALEYVWAMLPAIRGIQAVVMDRSWLSEVPYGQAFRGGKDRLGDEARAELELMAKQCAKPTLVMCLPAWETVRRNYSERKAMEMLDNESQLEMVYGLYDGLLNFRINGPAQELAGKVGRTIHYDYEATTWEALMEVL